MRAFTVPLERLGDAAAWFVRKRELRLLHALTSPDLRAGAIAVVMGQECHADNRSPFARLDDPHLAGETGWGPRAERLREQHEARQKAMAEAGLSLPALPALIAEDELTGFAVAARQVADARCPPLEGLVIVLAPTQVEEARAWQEALSHLLAAPGLADVRWVLIDVEAATAPKLLERLGPSALSVDCRLDPAAVEREMGDMLASAAAAPAEAPGLAKVGAAWPRGVTPPPRIGRPSATPEEQRALMIAAGVTPALADGGDELRRLVLGAAQALRRGDGPEAVRMQREARDLCARGGLGKESVVMELILGGYLAQLGERGRALSIYRAAAERADAGGHTQEAVQAQLAQGMLHTLEKNAADAAVAYAQAGRLAEQHGLILLAVESYRLAGQAIADPVQKVQAWKAALRVARAAPEPEIAASSADETAAALAELLRRYDLDKQAEAVEHDADFAPPLSAPIERPTAESEP